MNSVASKPTEKPVSRNADALLKSLNAVVSTAEQAVVSPRPASEPPRSEVDQDARDNSAVPSTPALTLAATDDAAPARKINRRREPRAKLDVPIDPGEGSAAIYVRVSRVTHFELKVQALQNQATNSGPTDIASIVREAVEQYLAPRRATRAAG